LWPRVLLEREQLLRAESLIVNLGCGLDQILQVGPEERHPSSFRIRTNVLSLLPGQEVAQRHELAMSLILNIDHPPTVFPSAYRLATNDHVPLGSNHGEWNHVLRAT